MKKNNVFTFIAPNGVEVTGVCLDLIRSTYEYGVWYVTYLCYAQNRLFTIKEERGTVTVAVDIDEFGDDVFEQQEYITQNYGEVLVDYAILPDYDEQLERYNNLQVAQAET
jgi:hypothetical protein